MSALLKISHHVDVEAEYSVSVEIGRKIDSRGFTVSTLSNYGSMLRGFVGSIQMRDVHPSYFGMLYLMHVIVFDRTTRPLSPC